MKQLLCNLQQLEATQAKSLTAEINGETTDIFLVRNVAGVFGYIDRCPHTGTPLEWKSDHFLDDEFESIVCATHGARFRIDDGYCIAGPCKRQSLTGLDLEVEGDVIYLLG